MHLGWPLHILVFLTAFTIVVLRRPDAILNPQFWAEDGAIWYANAYNLGLIHSLFLPAAGYFSTISRIVAAFAQIFPFSWAPLFFNVIAIVIQVLPANLMVSSRFSVLIPDLKTRIFLSFLYLALPNSWEIHANLSTASWHLALLAFMVLVAPANNPVWRYFDTGVVLLSGLSGPFSLLLTPIAALRWWLRREKRLLSLLLIISTCALIQTTCIVLTLQDSRSQTPLEATPELFVRILSGQVFLGALIGQRGYEWIISPSGLYAVLASVISMTGLIVIINALFKAPMELRFFIIFASLNLGAALISPQASSNAIPQWQVLSLPGLGGRYWFIPMLAFVVVLVWMLGKSSSSWLRVFSMLALAIMAIGIVLDWRHPPFIDFNFKGHARQFEVSQKGTKITIAINPPPWSMTLIKH